MPGYHEVGGTCVVCSPGYGTSTKGNRDCYDCPAGKASDQISNLGVQCYDCDWGKFTKDTRQAGCLSCAEYGLTLPSKSLHYYTTGRGMSSCKQCLPGSVVVTAFTVSEDGSTQTLTGQSCVSCTDAKYADPLYDTCVTCPPGKSTDSAHGYSQCYTCPGGKYNEGAVGTPTVCTDCPRGKYSGDGYSTCLTCAAGKDALSILMNAITLQTPKEGRPPFYLSPTRPHPPRTPPFSSPSSSLHP